LTRTPTVIYGLLLEDFEHPSAAKKLGDPTNTADYINYFGGSNLTDYGPKQTPTVVITPSYIFPYPNLAVEIGPQSDHTIGHYIHIWGITGPNVPGDYDPPNYPYAQAQLLFGHPVNIALVSPNKGFSFDYKTSLAVGANGYRFELLDKTTENYAYWGYALKPNVDGNWHHVTTTFASLATAFTPNTPWTTLVNTALPPQFVGFQIKPANASKTASMQFDICVDNITFN
jgi:hypothetical protein